MKDILLAGRKLNAVVDDVLDLGRMEALDISEEASGEGVDPAATVRQSLASMEGRFREKGLNVEAALAEALPRVFVDPSMFAKVVAAIVDNAVKFTPEQGLIRISVVPVGDCAWLPEEPFSARVREHEAHGDGQDISGIRVCVEDSGTGIDPALVERVFEPFFQIQGGITGKTPGTGLGLSLVRRFVEINGGIVRAYSQGADTGCSVCFTLPGSRHGTLSGS